MTGYRPVSCDIHSQYEEAILLRRRLRLRWHTPDGTTHEEVVQPLDVITCDKEEFLVVRDAQHQELSIRLDRIVHAQTIK